MTRLSDLLRSAADRAPVGDAAVSLSRATRRVRAQRGVRGVGNGVAGMGAFALVIFGVVQPGLANDAAATRDAAAPELAPDPASGGAQDSVIASDGKWMSWGTCGSFPLQDYGSGGTDALSIVAAFDGGSTPEGGTTLDIPVTVTASQDLALTTNGPDAAVLWEGMVVATLTASQTEQALNLAAGDTVESVASLALVDCFAGEPLPASSYQLVVSQAYLNATPAPTPTVEPTVEPTVAPTVEPTVEPLPEPQPRTTLPPDAGDQTGAGAGDSGEAGVAPGDVQILPVEPQGWDYRITSEPISFAVAGDPVDNPFADYYPQPWTPPTQPEDMLTPAIARELFDAAATSVGWDMAEGTSRWILPNGYGDVQTFAPEPAEQGYFGCSWDGVSGLTFPTRSANLDLLSISADAPSRLSISYGWVVDDNPEVTLSVTNTSSYSIPGFYGEPSRSLYLVKDGRVVAEAFPANTDPNGQMLAKGALTTDTAGVARDAVGDAVQQGAALQKSEVAPDEADSYWGLLAPGESVSGTYLWRDVNRCWRDDGSTANLSAGTYTLLAMQSISLQQYGTGAGVGGVTTGGVAVPQPEVLDIPVDPAVTTVAPVQEDWLELQAWTSLGTVTITTH
jgi:hypothetical protein